MSKNTTTTIQEQRLQPYQQAMQQAIYGGLTDIMGRPMAIPDYEASIAGLTPQQIQAMNMAQSGIGGYQPMLDQAGQLTGQAAEAAQQFTQQATPYFDTAGDLSKLGTETAEKFTTAASPYLTAGAEAMGGFADTASGLTSEAAEVARQTGGAFDPTSVSEFMDPYEQEVVDRALADIRRQGDIERSGIGAQAAQAGAFGGSRFALQEAELGRNILDRAGSTAANLRSAGYKAAMDQARQSFEGQQARQQGIAQLLGQSAAQQLGIGTSLADVYGRTGQGLAGLGTNLAGVYSNAAGQQQALGTGLAGLGTNLAQTLGQAGTQFSNLAGQGQGLRQADVSQLFGYGAQLQAQRQAELDARLQQQQAFAQEPYKRLGFVSDVFASQPTSPTTFQQSQQPEASRTSQLLGLGVAALGASKGFNPFAAS